MSCGRKVLDALDTSPRVEEVKTKLDALLARIDVDTKLFKDEVAYIDTSNSFEHCADCVNFDAPDKCFIVAGSISKEGWCELFSGDVAERADAEEWKEEKHPRDEDGKFSSTPQVGKGSKKEYKTAIKEHPEAAKLYNKALEVYKQAYEAKKSGDIKTFSKHHMVAVKFSHAAKAVASGNEAEGQALLAKANKAWEALSASKTTAPKAEPPKAEPPKAEPPKAEPPKAEPPKSEPSKVAEPTQAPEPVPPKKPQLDKFGIPHSTLGNLVDNWEKVTPQAKEQISVPLMKLHAIGSMTDQQAAIAVGQLDKISGSGQAVNTVNAVIGALKEKFASKSKSKPAHKVITQTSICEDPHGKELHASLRIDTKAIANHGYEKVTEATKGDSKASYTLAVNDAMNSYLTAQAGLFSPKETTALGHYKDGAYAPINDCLLHPEECGQYAKDAIAEIDKAMQKARIPADLEVWRGIGNDLKAVTGVDDPEKLVGRVFSHKNYSSVTRNPHLGFVVGAKVRLKMTLKAGTPGVVLGKQSHGSEAEIVLPRHAVYEITGYEKTPDNGVILHVNYLGAHD